MQFDNQTTRNVADIVARILAGESAKTRTKDVRRRTCWQSAQD
jgi:hypothetical protein